MTLSENYEKFCEIQVMLVLFDAINTHGFYILSRFWISRPRKSAPDFHGVRSPKKRTQSEQIHVLLFFSPCQSSIIDFSQWASSGSAATKKQFTNIKSNSWSFCVEAITIHLLQYVTIPFHIYLSEHVNVETISKYRCFPTHLTFHESFDSETSALMNFKAISDDTGGEAVAWCDHSLSL